MAYNPTQRRDHIVRGLGKLLQQFKEKPFLDGMVRPWLRQIQRAEDALWEVINSRALEDRQGVSLDLLGAIVGRGRNGLSDADYRIAIRAQIRINRSSGSTKDVIDIGNLSVPDPSGYWEYGEFYPASILVYLANVAGTNGELFFDNLRRAKAAAVRLQVLFWYPDDAMPSNSAFTWDTIPDSLDNTHGWGTVTQMPDPEIAVGGIGGTYSHVFDS